VENSCKGTLKIRGEGPVSLVQNAIGTDGKRGEQIRGFLYNLKGTNARETPLATQQSKGGQSVFAKKNAERGRTGKVFLIGSNWRNGRTTPGPKKTEREMVLGGGGGIV